MFHPDVIAAAAANALLPSPADQRRIIDDAGVTDASIARRLGVTQSTASRWISGARRPGGARLIEYALLLRELRSIADAGEALREARNG